jgi:ribosomal silencing factor RsfS
MVDYIIATSAASPVNAKTIFQKLQSIITTKGGGKPNRIEGRADCDWPTFNNAIKQILEGAIDGK